MQGDLGAVLKLPVHLLLIGSIVIVSVLGWIVPPLKRALILVPYQVRHRGQVYRLLTAAWLHADLSHLAFNMFTLYFFAGQALQGLGVTRFLVLYISAAVMAFVPTTLRYMNTSNYASLGASGAVAAVMFSVILLFPKMKLYLMFFPMPLPGIVFALGYLAYSAWHSYRAGDGVNHDAHFSGAIYGAMLTFAFEPARVERTIRGFLQ